jgi:hypothetical protein
MKRTITAAQLCRLNPSRKQLERLLEQQGWSGICSLFTGLEQQAEDILMDVEYLDQIDVVDTFFWLRDQLLPYAHYAEYLRRHGLDAV